MNAQMAHEENVETLLSSRDRLARMLTDTYTTQRLIYRELTDNARLYENMTGKPAPALVTEIVRVPPKSAPLPEPASDYGGRNYKGRPLAPGRCSYCLKWCDNLQRDHIDPVALGGTDDPLNLVPACPSCNRSKRASTLLQFLARQVSA